MKPHARVLIAVAIAVAPATGSAEVLKLFAELHGGWLRGSGVAGDLKDVAFFAQAKGPAYGALVGAKVLFVNGWIQHHQLPGGEGLKTWTQFGIGTSWSLDLGSADDGLYVGLGAGLWYGIGSGAQGKPPTDPSRVTDHGILAEGRISVGKHLSSIFDLGIAVPLSYGYFLRGSSGAATDLSRHYIGFEAEVLLALRANLIAL